MISRASLKEDIDALDESQLETVHRILTLLKSSPLALTTQTTAPMNNPLKGSVLFEDDLVSPIEEPWDAAR